jgi:hypothetical protein
MQLRGGGQSLEGSAGPSRRVSLLDLTQLTSTHQHTITTRHSCNARRRRGLSTVQPQSHLFNITAPW